MGAERGGPRRSSRISPRTRRRYGYWAVLLVVAGDGVFPLLPGETAIVAAAVLAANGALSLPLVILAGAAGAVIGDSCAYWIGRAGGGPIKRFVTRVRRADAPRARPSGWCSRQGAALVFVGRFLPGIRIAINLSCGAGQMAYPRFLFFDPLGGDRLGDAGGAARLLRRQGLRRPALGGVRRRLRGDRPRRRGAIALKERQRVRRERAAAEAERARSRSGEPTADPGG